MPTPIEFYTEVLEIVKRKRKDHLTAEDYRRLNMVIIKWKSIAPMDYIGITWGMTTRPMTVTVFGNDTYDGFTPMSAAFSFIHELGHIITPEVGHGSMWRASCQRLGIRHDNPGSPIGEGNNPTLWDASLLVALAHIRPPSEFGPWPIAALDSATYAKDGPRVDLSHPAVKPGVSEPRTAIRRQQGDTQMTKIAGLSATPSQTKYDSPEKVADALKKTTGIQDVIALAKDMTEEVMSDTEAMKLVEMFAPARAYPRNWAEEAWTALASLAAVDRSVPYNERWGTLDRVIQAHREAHHS